MNRYQSYIHIGGKVTPKVADEIRGHISLELQADWGENTVSIDNVEELLTHIQKENGTLWFCGNEVPDGGAFEDLEEFLVENNIPFTRHTLAAHGYPNDVMEFRAGMEQVNENTCDDDGHPQMSIQVVRDILKDIQKTTENGESARGIVEDIQNTIKKFNVDYPEFDPLPKFEIDVNIS